MSSRSLSLSSDAQQRVKEAGGAGGPARPSPGMLLNAVEQLVGLDSLGRQWAVGGASVRRRLTSAELQYWPPGGSGVNGLEQSVATLS